ncbi:hypothetical protein ACFL5U_02955, partial [Candidatus Margulisiibacteriota bacterium]
EVSYANHEEWVEKLNSGKYDLFLMGYKADIDQLFTDEAKARPTDSATLIEPVFKTNGNANFSGYRNSKVDAFLEQLSEINPALRTERHKKLKEINKILYNDLPVIVLFYIEKL